jgi:type VI secretion system protein ImpK
MRLIDCFIEMLAYVVYFLKTAKARQPVSAQVRADIDRLVSQCDARALEKGIPKEDYDHARFAIFAWVDEAIMNSAWNEKEQWQRNQLQRIHFQTTDAGEIFYERLNSLGPHKRDVREVYYLCLAMGFTGRYIHEGDDFMLEQLRASNLKLLMGSSLGLPSLEKGELFPEAYPKASDQVIPKKSKPGLSLIMLLSIGFPVVFYGVLFLIYRFILSSIGQNLVSTVP